MQMSLCKLSFQNVRKSIKDYTVYFLTLMLGVCLFYLFNALDSQALVQGMSEIQQDIVRMMVEMMAVISVFISVVLGCLILYANRYLVKRRKKEFGIYMLLGMPKRKISGVLALETSLIGLFSLAVGLALGVFLSQGLSIVVSQMFKIQYSEFQVVFSPQALVKTILYFAVIFLVVMVFNVRTISKCKLIDLIQAERKNEQVKTRRLWVCVILFLLSLGVLGTAYAMIIKNGLQTLDGSFTLSIALGIVGTILFFMSLSGFLLRVVKSNRKLYLKNLNMFVLRQINSKVNTAFLSISIVCVLLFFAITITSTAIGFNSAMNADVEQSTPYSATFGYTQSERVDGDMRQELIDAGIDMDAIFEATEQYSYRETGITLGGLMGNLCPQKSEDHIVNGISVERYNALMRLQGKPEISLADGEYAVISLFAYLNDGLDEILQNGRTVEIGGQELRPGKQQILNTALETAMGTNNTVVLILPQTLAESLPVADSFLCGQYRAGDTDAFDNMLAAEPFVSPANGASIGVTLETEIYWTQTGTRVAFLFVLLYIGVVFMIVAAAALALQQLSEASDNVGRYALLSKLGVDRKMINRSIFSQVAIYFLIPMALAIVHSCVGIYVVLQMLNAFGEPNSFLHILTAGGIILAIYLVYFFATYAGCKSTVRQQRTT